METQVDDGAKLGHCSLCGQEMILGRDDAWHPYDVERACPVEPPDPKMTTEGSYRAWQEWYASGKRHGRPGREYWRPND